MTVSYSGEKKGEKRNVKFRRSGTFKASEISLCSLSGSLREYYLILDSDVYPEPLLIPVQVSKVAVMEKW